MSSLFFLPSTPLFFETVAASCELQGNARRIVRMVTWGPEDTEPLRQRQQLPTSKVPVMEG